MSPGSSKPGSLPRRRPNARKRRAGRRRPHSAAVSAAVSLGAAPLRRVPRALAGLSGKQHRHVDADRGAQWLLVHQPNSAFLVALVQTPDQSLHTALPDDVVWAAFECEWAELHPSALSPDRLPRLCHNFADARNDLKGEALLH